MCSVESLGYASNGGGSRMAASPARVEIVKPDAKGFATFEIVQECMIGLRGLLRIVLSKID